MAEAFRLVRIDGRRTTGAAWSIFDMQLHSKLGTYILKKLRDRDLGSSKSRSESSMQRRLDQDLRESLYTGVGFLVAHALRRQ